MWRQGFVCLTLSLVHSSVTAFFFHRDPCIPLPQCLPAVEFLLKKPFDPFTIRVLQLSHCGTHEGYPKVRCEKIQVPCKTPNNKDGICQPISECLPYLQLLESVDLSDQLTKKYLREFQCGDNTGESIQICCPEKKVVLQNKAFLPQPTREECGVGENDDRIVGGEVAEIGDFPWTALLLYRKGQKVEPACGGSLINDRHIITAAHCADPEFLKSVGYTEIDTVSLGEYDTRTDPDCVEFQEDKHCAPKVQTFRVERYILHPGWREKRFDDIAVVRLNRKATFNDYVKPICLPVDGLKLNGTEEFYVAGWGKTETLRSSPVKMIASIPLADQKSCAKMNENQICVGGSTGKDTCVGDSGSPLMLQHKVNDKFLTFLVGIVSSGPSFCGSSPGVYTYVPNYMDWIKDVFKVEELFL